MPDILGKQFLTLHKEAGLFHSEQWVNKDTTLFIPIVENTAIRVHSFDQITFPCEGDHETFFVGDIEEKYTGSVRGMNIFHRHNNT